MREKQGFSIIVDQIINATYCGNMFSYAEKEGKITIYYAVIYNEAIFSYSVQYDSVCDEMILYDIEMR